MSAERIPHHVAVIPDGNRRWAKDRKLHKYEGHKRGFELMTEIVKKARELGVDTLTFWALSTGNMEKREEAELSYLMVLYDEMLDRHLPDALENETRIIHAGRKDRIPPDLAKKITAVERQTADFRRHHLVIALDYGGDDEIQRALQAWKRENPDDVEIDLERDIFPYLDTRDLPYPSIDLIIRTSEQRLGSFFPLQSRNAEIRFVEEKFPDYTIEAFEEHVNGFGEIEQRHGK